MNYILLIFALLAFTLSGYSQKEEVINITRSDLQMKHLQTGNSTYLVYFKKTADGPAENLTLVKINVESTTIEGRKAYLIKQRWESQNSLTHTSETVHDAADFSTLKHDYWWKLPDSSEMLAKFDFIGRKASVEGKIDERMKTRILSDFEKSFESYNLSWHSDLTVFTLFPYKKGRTFKVNFYDPGASSAKVAEYRVTGSEVLTRGDGKAVDCWVMEYSSTGPNGAKAVQRFWVSKSSQEVLKEEDNFPSGLRYKFKLAVSGEK